MSWRRGLRRQLHGIQHSACLLPTPRPPLSQPFHCCRRFWLRKFLLAFVFSAPLFIMTMILQNIPAIKQVRTALLCHRARLAHSPPCPA